MSRLSKHPAAMVVLPSGVSARTLSPGARRWLAKGSVRRMAARKEPLKRVLELLGRPLASEGLAALRQWGQTGARPEGWICAADPVYLEARLDHLCLFALHDVGEDELASLIAAVQSRLASDQAYAFSSVGRFAYLARADAMDTAMISALEVDGESPDAWLPEGPAAAAHDRLQSELQMCLHELASNRSREEAGRLPINALWFWGGGRAPAPAEGRSLPMLFADDPLATGYWMAAGGSRAPWPGGVAECAVTAAGPFVAIPPHAETSRPEALQALLAGGKLATLTLSFDDGLRIDLKPGDRLRFWRRRLAWPEEPGSP